jgi:hypothetical protein
VSTAFVVRKGQPARYIRIGPTDDIERDVASLEAGVIGLKSGAFASLHRHSAPPQMKPISD